MTATRQPRIRIEDLPALERLSEEEAALILGAGRFRPGVEQLEDRLVMTASLASLQTSLAQVQHLQSNLVSTISQQRAQLDNDLGAYAPRNNLTIYEAQVFNGVGLSPTMNTTTLTNDLDNLAVALAESGSHNTRIIGDLQAINNAIHEFNTNSSEITQLNQQISQAEQQQQQTQAVSSTPNYAALYPYLPNAAVQAANGVSPATLALLNKTNEQIATGQVNFNTEYPTVGAATGITGLAGITNSAWVAGNNAGAAISNVSFDEAAQGVE